MQYLGEAMFFRSLKTTAFVLSCVFIAQTEAQAEKYLSVNARTQPLRAIALLYGSDDEQARCFQDAARDQIKQNAPPFGGSAAIKAVEDAIEIMLFIGNRDISSESDFENLLIEYANSHKGGMVSIGFSAGSKDPERIKEYLLNTLSSQDVASCGVTARSLWARASKSEPAVQSGCSWGLQIASFDHSALAPTTFVTKASYGSNDSSDVQAWKLPTGAKYVVSIDGRPLTSRNEHCRGLSDARDVDVAIADARTSTIEMHRIRIEPEETEYEVVNEVITPPALPRNVQTALVYEGIDFFKGDLDGYQKGLGASNINQCISMCQSVSECTAATYNTKSNRCFLKGEGEYQPIITGATQSVRFVDQEWDDYSIWAASVLGRLRNTFIEGERIATHKKTSLFKCARLCLLNDDCEAFNHQDDIKTCWLRSNSNMVPEPLANLTSGRKTYLQVDMDYEKRLK